MTNSNLTDERLSALIRVARDSLELYEMELPVIDDVMLALAELQQRRAAMLQGADQATVKQPSSNSVLGWLRADYQDDNRGLRGNAPLFVLGKKDPSTVWGLDYIPLTSNSPVIPDGWVMLPAEPTQAMMNAWLSEVSNWRGHAAGYRAMIAAAPQQEAKNV
ncbi:hypothetical protein [Enterobacter hormaechei]|uniref:hypothetical protein n=1 Tax=Enterobacter hormaechei TaxID=158836 RepID=UPI0007988DD5|nr:hypothetical protein [Enterobacter hormaechei]CZY60218.1 Uncharacterised protein [Enterobacter hormaechei]CZY61988.1 Uncharacterised protein [Enterobacter hormaechei]CZY72284.1 Uncharacterised protein [Enterobacter hormaechei]SAF37527.1 Uncharacterised protein [Enterobacter hormaechei]